MSPTRVWRLRMSAHGKDYTEDGWQAGELGIWYGAWSADDLSHARQADDLNALLEQQKLGWKVRKSYYDTAVRFRDIAESDWVLVYLKRQRCLGLAQLGKPLQSRDQHIFNDKDGEVFKFRQITKKKSFFIEELPDAYQLLAAQGRSNVHELPSMRQHAEALLQYNSSEELLTYVRTLELSDLLDFLGASGWESFCMAYLIAEHRFLPTGLSPGRTLAVLDLVGRRQSDGARIYAQCKKSNTPVEINEDFLSIAKDSALLYFFAFGGVIDAPPQMRVFTKEDAVDWASTTSGKRYVSLLRGEVT